MLSLLLAINTNKVCHKACSVLAPLVKQAW
ncbi:Uncharacterised protein [Vibrio cholerae]|nr:Uncharacterised protein [Vibrio cholerae]